MTVALGQKGDNCEGFKVRRIGNFGGEIFDVVDTVDNSLIDYEVAWIKFRRGNLITLRQGDSVPIMVRKLKQLVKSSSIKKLRFHGHGFPGYQGIAIGNKYSPNPYVAMSSDNFRTIAPMLDLLTDSFAPGARVDLLGCNVAQGAKGGTLLKQLADLWGVPVTGGINIQYAGSPKADLGSENTTISHEGPTKTANPSRRGVRTI